MTIDPDEFEVWQNHPVTVAYFERIDAEITRTKEWWDSLSWNDKNWTNGLVNHGEFATHYSRVKTLEFMRTLGFEDIFQKEDNERSS